MIILPIGGIMESSSNQQETPRKIRPLSHWKIINEPTLKEINNTLN